MRFFSFFIIVSSIFVLFSTEIWAQIEYRKGFIITNTRDTVEGSLGIKKTNQFYNYCYFKAYNSKKIKRYNPEELYAFGIKGSIFFMSIDPQIRDQGKKVYARLLVQGKASLFKSGNIYFIYKNDKIYKLDEDYKKLLGELMDDCSEVKYDILLVKKEDVALSRLLENYNECAGKGSITYHYEPAKVILSPSLAFGGYSSQLVSNIKNRDDNRTKNTSVSQQMYGGVNLEMMFTKFSKRLSFNVGVYYLSADYLIDFYQVLEPQRYSTGPTETIYEETTITHSSIQTPMMIKYNLPKDLWNMYVGAGISYHIIYDFKYESIYESVIESNVNINTFSSTMSPTTIQHGIILAAGVDRIFRRYLNLSLEIRAELGTGIYRSENENYSINSNTQNLYATVFYRF